jgi:catechol 2,3-dioxygenase-like lactoylglutathione lyase family enzyme
MAGPGAAEISSPVALLGRIDQICFLVEDLDTAIAHYSRLFDAEHWREYEYGPETVPALGYGDGEGKLSFRLALSDCDPQVELIQSLRGPSIYSDWVERNGYGLHHLGFFTTDMGARVRDLEMLGLRVSQWGRGYGLDGDGGFTYFDSVAAFGFIIELIEIPRRRRRPRREWAIRRCAE